MKPHQRHFEGLEAKSLRSSSLLLFHASLVGAEWSLNGQLERRPENLNRRDSQIV